MASKEKSVQIFENVGRLHTITITITAEKVKIVSFTVTLYWW